MNLVQVCLLGRPHNFPNQITFLGRKHPGRGASTLDGEYRNYGYFRRVLISFLQNAKCQEIPFSILPCRLCVRV